MGYQLVRREYPTAIGPADPSWLRGPGASVLLDGGEGIKAVNEYLGHSDSGFTLRTFTHLMRSSEARIRKAVDRALGDGEGPADGPETAQKSRE